MPPLLLFHTTRFLSSVNASLPGGEQFPHVAPVHADEGNRAIAHHPRQVRQRLSEESGELRLAHLAAGKGEFVVLDRTQATDVAVDRNVVGRIGEHQIGARLAVH